MNAKKTDSVYELQTYTIKRPCGFYRLALTDILSDLAVCAPEILDQFPPAIWRVLSLWFLEYRFNNLYHFHFWKVYQLIIRDSHLESLKLLFTKNKFLTKMIEHYRSSEPSGSRGFIIVMCNTLRFAADLQLPTEYLRHYLSSLEIWKSFLPQLRADTLVQQKKYDDLIYMTENGDDEVEEDEGIDLGSAYARSLGFEEMGPIVVPESPKKKRNKKKKSKKSLTSSTGSAETKLTPQSPKTEKEQNLDWWKDMVSDLKHDEEEKVEVGNDDWWKELKEELHTMEDEHKSQTPNKEASA